MNRKLIHSLVALSALALPLAAHADTFTGTAAFSDTSTSQNNSYSFSGVFNNPSFSFSGPVGTTYTDSLTITSSGVSGRTGSASDDAISVTIDFSHPNAGVSGFSGTGEDFLTYLGYVNNSDIDWSSNSKTVTFTDGSSVLITLPDFDFSAYNTGSPFSGSEDLTIKVLTGSTATPEPSSLALLGTGVLGAAGAFRRRFVR